MSRLCNFVSLYNCRCLPSHAIVKRYLLLSIIDSICNIALFQEKCLNTIFQSKQTCYLILFGVRLSWTVWCQAVLDCLVSGCVGLLGVRLSWAVWCQAVLDCLVSGCLRTAWCQAVLDSLRLVFRNSFGFLILVKIRWFLIHQLPILSRMSYK